MKFAVGPVRVLRSGRCKKEFERAVFKSIDSSGRVTSRMRLAPPRPLGAVKCWDIVGASVEFCETLRAMGHRGIRISHYLQDGLHAKAFLRHARSKHKMLYEVADFGDEDVDPELLQDMDVVVGGNCKLHVASNGTKWGIRKVATRDILDNTHIAFMSLIQSSTSLRANLLPWLTESLVYATKINEQGSCTSERVLYWSAMGAPTDIMDLCIEVAARWDPISRTLTVNEALGTDPQGLKKVETFLMFCFSWRNFMEDRFAGVGPCSRRWLLSVNVGFDGLCEKVMGE